MTPLIAAASCGQQQALVTLLAGGARPAVAAVGGVTALHVAARAGHPDAVASLLQAGCAADEYSTPRIPPCLEHSCPIRVDFTRLTGVAGSF